MHLLQMLFGNEKSGEMYFYYVPKGILKKKPVNVYEVPRKFNINEGEYLKLVNELYQIIKELKQDFVDTEQELWTSLTISIAHCKFYIEFFYDDINQDEQSCFERHIIWRYKYLHIGGEKKEERKILDEYFKGNILEPAKETYQTGIYVKSSNNMVGFDKEIEEAKVKQEEQKQKAEEIEKRKSQKIQEKVKKQEEKIKKEEERIKNQILYKDM